MDSTDERRRHGLQGNSKSHVTKHCSHNMTFMSVTVVEVRSVSVLFCIFVCC